MDQESTDTGTQGLAGVLNNLNQRERVLLAAMAVIGVLIVVMVLVTMARQSVADVEEQTRQHQTALTALIEYGPEYVGAQAPESDGGQASRVDLFTEDVLENNEVQLTSYVASHASAVDVSVSSYDVDESPIGSSGDSEDDGPMIEERRLRIDIRNAEMDRLVELLHRLEESREPVVISRVDIRSVRDEGQVRALVVVSTFQYVDNGEES